MVEAVVVLLLGLAIGTVAGWFIRSSHLALLKSQLEDARQSLDQLGRQRDNAAEQLREESNRRATFEALAAGIPELQREIESRSLALNQHQRTLLEITTEKEALAATIQ